MSPALGIRRTRDALAFGASLSAAALTIGRAGTACAVDAGQSRRSRSGEHRTVAIQRRRARATHAGDAGLPVGAFGTSYAGATNARCPTATLSRLAVGRRVTRTRSRAVAKRPGSGTALAIRCARSADTWRRTCLRLLYWTACSPAHVTVAIVVRFARWGAHSQGANFTGRAVATDGAGAKGRDVGHRASSVRAALAVRCAARACAARANLAVAAIAVRRAAGAARPARLARLACQVEVAYPASDAGPNAVQSQYVPGKQSEFERQGPGGTLGSATGTHDCPVGHVEHPEQTPAAHVSHGGQSLSDWHGGPQCPVVLPGSWMQTCGGRHCSCEEQS
jgi:hypothetical protein